MTKALKYLIICTLLITTGIVVAQSQADKIRSQRMLMKMKNSAYPDLKAEAEQILEEQRQEVVRQRTELNKAKAQEKNVRYKAFKQDVVPSKLDQKINKTTFKKKNTKISTDLSSINQRIREQGGDYRAVKTPFKNGEVVRLLTTKPTPLHQLKK